MKKMEKQSFLGRTAMTLAAVMLTAMTAWAHEVVIELTNVASQYVYCGNQNQVKPDVMEVTYDNNVIDLDECKITYDNNNRAGENEGSVYVTLPSSYGDIKWADGWGG